MVMIEISESKVDKMYDLAGKMLKYGGKLMQCLEEIPGNGNMGERWEEEYEQDEMGPRGNYDRMPDRGIYGNRRGVRVPGRYPRYM